MHDFKDKVAVITGGASGIGLAMARAFAADGMKIVIGDIEREALDAAKATIEQDGAECATVLCDVSKREEVAKLAAETINAFGKVNVVCNNAGVGFGGPSWEIDIEDWEWVLGVDLWGVIYGVHEFVPRILEAGEPGYIINTASMAGLAAGPGMAPYNVSKFGVVALSECLYHEMQLLGAPVGVSVLCPGWVQSKITDSSRNRPGGPVADEDLHPLAQALNERIRQAVSAGLTPEYVSELVVQAVREDKFYILPHSSWKVVIEGRMRNIVDERNPEIIEPPTEPRSLD